MTASRRDPLPPRLGNDEPAANRRVTALKFPHWLPEPLIAALPSRTAQDLRIAVEVALEHFERLSGVQAWWPFGRPGGETAPDQSEDDWVLFCQDDAELSQPDVERVVLNPEDELD